MPNPPYSEEARKAKYSGVVLVDAVVAVDGRVTEPRILKSPGLGLDDVTLATMKTWRCRAGLGPSRRPVPTEVQFEVNFRLY
jgi:protein TonB